MNKKKKITNNVCKYTDLYLWISGKGKVSLGKSGDDFVHIWPYILNYHWKGNVSFPVWSHSRTGKAY